MQEGKWRYDLAILWITAVWGSTFVIGKELITSLAPLNYLSARFLLATVLFVLLFPRTLYAMRRESIRGGGILGAFLSLGFITQSVGLLYTTPAKSAFVTGVAVILVPFLGYLLAKVEVTKEHVTSVFLAATGFALLTLPESSAGVNLGDLITFAGTIFWALHIVCTGIFARHADTRQLTLIQFVASTFIFVLVLVTVKLTGSFAALTSSAWPKEAVQIWQLGYLAVVATLLVLLVQTRVQRYISPTRAAVIFSLEPVFASIASYLWNGERLSARAALGGLLIVLAIAISESKLFSRRV